MAGEGREPCVPNLSSVASSPNSAAKSPTPQGLSDQNYARIFGGYRPHSSPTCGMKTRRPYDAEVGGARDLNRATSPLRLRRQKTSTAAAADKQRPESRGRSKQHRKKRLLLLSQSSPTTSPAISISSSLADAYSIYSRGATGLDGATLSTACSFFEDNRTRPRTADTTSTSTPSATMIFVTTRSPPPRAASANGARHGAQSCGVVISPQKERSTSRSGGGNKTNRAHPTSPSSDDPAVLNRLGRLAACNGLNNRRAREEGISTTFRSPASQRPKTEPQYFSPRVQEGPRSRFPEPGRTCGRPLLQHSVAVVKAGPEPGRTRARPLLQDSVAVVKAGDRRGARRQRARKATTRRKAAAGVCPESSVLSPERAAARMANLRKVYGEHSVNLWRSRSSAS